MTDKQLNAALIAIDAERRATLYARVQADVRATHGSPVDDLGAAMRYQRERLEQLVSEVSQ